MFRPSRLSLVLLGAVVLLLALAVPAGAAIAEPAATNAFSPAERKKLTGIIKKAMVDLRQPGVNVGIWVPGRGNYVRTFGVADRATGRKLRLNDRFRIASITKSFTATAVLQLVDEGKLSLEDKLETYIPGIPNGGTITIRNLLGMTSGIYDFTSDEQFLADFTANPLLPFDLDDVIAIVKRHDPLFSPGEKVVYCDTNYWFLGAIIEKVTGQPVEDVIQSKILLPLGLGGTSFPTTPAMPDPYAHGYFAGDDGKGPFRDYTRTNPNVAWTAGAMISTLSDLRAWGKELVTGTLLSPATQAERLKIGSFPNPGGPSVGYGLGIFKIGGFLGHNGAIFGYSTIVMTLPGTNATIVIESNQSSNFLTATTNMFLEIGKYLFPQQFKPS